MAERNPKQEATLDLWRIYRTTKEMAKDRVGASAGASAMQR